MKCQNRLCIYQNDNLCTCDKELELDWHGTCSNMVLIRITNNHLSAEKLVTKMEIQDNKHCINNQTGIVTLSDDAFTK